MKIAVEITVEDGALVVRVSKRHPREGWAEAARRAADAGDEVRLDDTPLESDNTECDRGL